MYTFLLSFLLDLCLYVTSFIRTIPYLESHSDPPLIMYKPLLQAGDGVLSEEFLGWNQYLVTLDTMSTTTTRRETNIHTYVLSASSVRLRVCPLLLNKLVSLYRAQTLMRRRIMRRLIWVYAVCQARLALKGTEIQKKRVRSSKRRDTSANVTEQKDVTARQPLLKEELCPSNPFP
ncbi:hypothetical protein DPMN_123779 [Dreissena polymorpha]|uniref:Uncharacterized protein n=1 Tax=Dreissena polymorpha TaxID=45954 RepID=A0A9D4GRZ7_DREPO|nr:hypothetical protein DPMN_123779 [Dreissena polymorpha]